MTVGTRLAAAGLAATVGFVAQGAMQPAPATTYGFVLSDLNSAFYRGSEKTDCPTGRSPNVREAFLATQSPAEQARLLKPENAEEFERKYKVDYVMGPNGTDICTDPKLFDTPDRVLQKLSQSKIAYGFDLDGAAAGATAPGTCQHDSFTSPTGEKGVDNQLYRVIGCNTMFRGAENAQDQQEYSWPENPTIVLVRGVDSWEDDPDVEVLFASAKDRPSLDVKQQLAPGGSLTISDNPEGRTIAKGRIVDGLLTTEPTDLVIKYNWLGNTGGEFISRHFRLRVRLGSDGTLKGEAAGYRPIDNALGVLRIGGPGVASAAGVECASLRKSMRLAADGDKDPKTGQCTTLSSAMRFNAVPAFIFDGGKLLNP